MKGPEEAREKGLELGRGVREGTSHLLGLLGALSDLVMATGDLIQQHLELLGLEAREDITELSKRLVLLIAVVGMLVFGYVLLLLGSVLLLGWGWGVPGMALGTLTLALVHVLVALPSGWQLMRRWRRPGGFTRSGRELEKTKQWVNQQIEKGRGVESEIEERRSGERLPRN